MGYPMTYGRLVGRNNLRGDYPTVTGPNERINIGCIRGDMRRLESDSRDEYHLKRYAEAAGITPEQAKKLLDLFFDTGGGPPFTAV
jgi:hypothetical protein